MTSWSHPVGIAVQDELRQRDNAGLIAEAMIDPVRALRNLAPAEGQSDPNATTQFCPPKPKAFVMARRTRCSRATSGT